MEFSKLYFFAKLQNQHLSKRIVYCLESLSEELSCFRFLFHGSVVSFEYDFTICLTFSILSSYLLALEQKALEKITLQLCLACNGGFLLQS